MTKKNRMSRLERMEVLDFKLCFGLFVMLFAVGIVRTATEKEPLRNEVKQ